ncbi:MAG: hypothetical protein LAO08_07135 [Acidobacteriia bacterium]|nr:hypothetical protein [Terriglobia bacterium]
MSSYQTAYLHKRRSTRIDRALPLAVQGVGALREPYQEQVSTLTISCHGCTYQTKHEVLQGEIVFLEVKPSKDGTTGSSSRARVKWVHRLPAPDRGYQVAVELENAGNIWEIPSPPEDWFPVQMANGNELPAATRELRVVSRTEQKIAPAQDAGLVKSSGVEKQNTVAPQLASLAQLMAGFGEQIQIMSAEAARNALVNEKSRQMEEFRAQLRDEAAKTVQSVIAASKEDISRQALKSLLDAHEAGARINHARWIKKIEQDLETARQHMLRQIKEVTQRIDTLAAAATERVQKNMETTRDEAMTRFVSRFREQVAPLLAEANDALQTLAASEAAFKNETRSFSAGIEKQIATSADTSMAKVQQELAQTANSVAEKTTETLQQLSQNIEKAAQDNLNSLLASLGGNVTKLLEERTAEISREFSSGIETYTRNYFEQIGRSIAEIPRNTTAQSSHQ